MKKLPLGILALTLTMAAAGCAASNEKPLPAGSDKFPATTRTTVAAGVVDTKPPATTPTTVEVEDAASACDVTREALLTGSQADINASMARLMADKSADATAREYADYYLHRDVASPDMREMDVGLVRMACS